MNFVFFLMILFYWFFLSGVVFLAGAYAARVYVTGPSGAEEYFTGRRHKCFVETVTRYILLISILTFLVNAIHFILHCAVMTETPLNEVFSIVWLFMTKTKYGRFTIWRSAFLAVIIVISYIIVWKDIKLTKMVGSVFSLLLLTVIAMSGHQGVKGYGNISFFSDVLHLTAVSLWIGGIFFIRAFLAIFIKGTFIEFKDNIVSLANRFSHLATYCVFIAAFTGGLLSVINVKDLAALTKTHYGLILGAKIILVVIIMGTGGFNKFALIPRLNNAVTEDGTNTLIYSGRLLALMNIEATLGLAVLLLTSILTHLSPAG